MNNYFLSLIAVLRYKMYIAWALRPYYPLRQRRDVLSRLFNSVNNYYCDSDQPVTYEELLQHFGTYESFLSDNTPRRYLLPSRVITLLVITSLSLTAASVYHIYSLYHSLPAYCTESFTYTTIPEVPPHG